jgi:hypothetical protein
MHCLQAKGSSESSDSLDTKSCFDTDIKRETDSDTNPTDVGSDVERENKDKSNKLWVINKDKDHLPEYYLNQEEEFDKAKDTNKDYKDSSVVLLNKIKEQ